MNRTIKSLLYAVAFVAITSTTWINSVEAQSAASMKARIRADDSLGYGRIIIDFKDRTLLPKYDINTNSGIQGILVIEFDDPVEADIRPVSRALKDYVAIARRDPDGKAFRLALNDAYRVNVMEAGEKLFIDLLPKRWTGHPPSLPDNVINDLAKRASEAMKKLRAAEDRLASDEITPKLKIDVGRNPTFTRIKFAWNVPIVPAIERGAKVVSISFNQSAPVDLDFLRANLPPGVIDLDAVVKPDSTRVLLKIEDRADIRAFQEESIYFVDITVDGPEGPPTQNSDVLANADSNNTMTPNGSSNAALLPGTTQKSVADQLNPQNRNASGKPDASTSKQPDGTIAVNIPRFGTNVIADPTKLPKETPVKGIETGTGETRSADAKQRSRGNPEAGGKEKKKKLVGEIVAEVRMVDDAVRITFPFRKKTATSVFRRNKTIWMVFDTKDPLDISIIKRLLQGRASKIDHIKGEKYEAIRMDMINDVLATTSRDANDWIVTLGDLILEPSRPIAVKKLVRADGTLMLTAGLRDPAMTHKIADSKIGDEIFVTTALGPPRGISKIREYAQAKLLQTAHGLAIIPKVDDIRVEQEPTRVLIGRKGGLALSQGRLKRQSKILEMKSGVNDEKTLDIKQLRVEDHGKLLRNLDLIHHQVALSTGDDLIASWIDLARFQLANNLAYEALGTSRLVSKLDPTISNDETFKLLNAAANVLAGRHDEANRLLEDKSLDESADASFWRTIVASENRQWLKAHKAAPRGHSIIGNYPTDLQSRFILSAAEAALHLNDHGKAVSYLAELDPAKTSKSYLFDYDILRAQLADSAGRPADALALLDPITKANERPAVALARMLAVRIRLRDGLVEEDEAIEELERLTMYWRGDETELQALQTLARIRAARGDFRDAFEAMKAAMNSQPEADIARQLQDEMNGVFANLFLEGGADKLEPIKALGLYYDFKELTPIGRRGDELVRNLAARLVKIDLLAQAAELLQHQVEKRLKGSARASIAADLAVIHLLDEKPDAALKTIYLTRQASLPEYIVRRRRLIEARALIASGKPDLAIELVRSTTGTDAMRLRAKAYWDNSNWQQAGEELEAMHGPRWSEPTDLNDGERKDILRASIAYTLAGDQISIDRMRAKYSKKMSKSHYAYAFDIVTQPIDSKGVEFMSIAQNLAASQIHDGFLEEYRKNYLEGRRSTNGADEPTEPQQG